MDETDRIGTAQEAVAAAGLAAVVLVAPANVAYLAGFHATPFERLIALVLPAAGEPGLVVPALEVEAAGAAAPAGTAIFAWQDETGPEHALAEALAGLGGPIGIEHHALTVGRLELLERVAPGTRFSDCDDLVAGLRLRKTADELASLQEAARIVDEAMAQLAAAGLRAGRSEAEVAAECVRALREAGGATAGFEPSVLTGPRSALPHGKSGPARLADGDLVIVDFGAASGGYWADITRTFAVGGEPDARQREIVDVVRAAHDAGIDAARTGNLCRDVDLAARAVIEEAGYGEYFVHRTGHGLGLEVHEPPALTSANEQPLETGMVVTVEPGIYIPGWGGVRIEDDLVVGAEPLVLTRSAVGL